MALLGLCVFTVTSRRPLLFPPGHSEQEATNAALAMHRSEQENDLDCKVRRTRKKLESFSEARDILGEARTTASEDATVPSVESPMAVRFFFFFLFSKKRVYF